MTQNLYSVTVSATPDKLPDNVELDISALEIGDSVSVGDLPKSEDYEIITDPEEQIASISEPQTLEEDSETAEAAEPEVIGQAEKE